MIHIDGVAVHTSPATFARLSCGCLPLHPGHDTTIGDVVPCPDPDSCTGHDHGTATVRSTVRTEVLD